MIGRGRRNGGANAGFCTRGEIDHQTGGSGRITKGGGGEAVPCRGGGGIALDFPTARPVGIGGGIRTGQRMQPLPGLPGWQNDGFRQRFGFNFNGEGPLLGKRRAVEDDTRGGHDTGDGDVIGGAGGHADGEGTSQPVSGNVVHAIFRRVGGRGGHGDLGDPVGTWRITIPGSGLVSAFKVQQRIRGIGRGSDRGAIMSDHPDAGDRFGSRLFVIGGNSAGWRNVQRHEADGIADRVDGNFIGGSGDRPNSARTRFHNRIDIVVLGHQRSVGSG